MPRINDMKCAAPDCGRGAVIRCGGRPVCNLHYQRWLRYSAFDNPPKTPSRRKYNCHECGASFERTYALSQRRQAKRQYCSLDCEVTAKRDRALARAPARFWAKVEKRGPEDCWPWKAQLNQNGYGKFQMLSGQPWLAHRAAIFFAQSVDPGEHDVCHSCDNPPCCNPGHLWLGDAKANVADMIAKGRAPVLQIRRGHANNMTRLSAEKALAIVASDEPNQVLAEKYSVTAAAIYNVRHGKAWAHVTGVARG